MPALPTVGGSNGTWGSELNAFLQVSHGADGRLNSAVSGTGAGPAGDSKVFFELEVTADDVVQGPTFLKVDGLRVLHHFGGSAAKGGRHAIEGNLFLDGGATHSANTDRNYVGLQGQFIAFDSDGGTSTSDYRGAGFGLGSWAEIQSTDSFFQNLTGAEFNTVIAASTSEQVNYVSGIQIAGKHLKRGALWDTGIAISGLSGHLGFKTGLLIGDMNGSDALASDSTVVQVINHPTLAKGFDFSSTAFTDYVLNANGFTIGAPAGNHSIEIGRQDGTSSTPFMDWHTGATAVDYDVRLIASESDGSSGGGVLSVHGSFAIATQRTGYATLTLTEVAAQTGYLLLAQSSAAARLFSISADGQIRTSSGNESTGAGSALLGSNSPASTLSAPYTWLKFTTNDNSQVYVPAWK